MTLFVYKQCFSSPELVLEFDDKHPLSFIFRFISDNLNNQVNNY